VFEVLIEPSIAPCRCCSRNLEADKTGGRASSRAADSSILAMPLWLVRSLAPP